MEGKEIEGIIQASDKKEVVNQLRQRQLFPISIRYIKKARNLNSLNLLSNITSKDLYIFCKQYASMLRAGVPPVQGLYMTINQISNPLLKASLEKIYSLVQEGYTLSQAMRKDNKFPIILISTIEAGEWSGTLDISFDRMADYFEKQYKTNQKLCKALAYPIFLTITSILIVYFLMRMVVPQFITLFANAQVELPIYTRILLGISHFFINNSILFLLFLPIIYLISRLAKYHRSFGYFLDSILLKSPYFGNLINKVISARFNRTVAILISAGISIAHALAISAKVTKNEFVNRKLVNIVSIIQQGESLSKALSSLGIFSEEIINFIAIGEESGQVEEMMNKVADICEVEAEAAIDRFIALLEPISVLILGGMIAFIVISIILPIFEMYTFLG